MLSCFYSITSLNTIIITVMRKRYKIKDVCMVAWNEQALYFYILSINIFVHLSKGVCFAL